MSMIKDKLVSYNRELHNILTEEDRKKINQVLTSFSNTRKSIPKITKHTTPKDQGTPHISDVTVHDEFKLENMPEEFDEVPHLLLFRTHFSAMIRYKATGTLMHIQELCTMSGISNIVHTAINTTLCRLSGSFDKGGMVKSVIFYLEKKNNDLFCVKECIFKGLKNL